MKFFFKVLEYLYAISSPLGNKTKGEKSWLSGSFHKQQHDEKHMASQHQETGSFAAPWRSRRPGNSTAWASGCKPPHLPAQVSAEVGRAAGLRADWQDAELKTEARAW